MWILSKGTISAISLGTLKINYVEIPNSRFHSHFALTFAVYSAGAWDQMQEGALGEVYRCPSWEVPASTRAKVHWGWYHTFLGVVLLRSCTGYCPEVLGRVQGTLLSENGWSPRTIVDFSPAFLSFRSVALPKEEAIKKLLPKATEAIRKVQSKASHSYKWWRREDCYTHDKFLLQPYLWNITKLLCSFLSCHWR